MKKTVLITGASSGLGKSTAKMFNAKGWNVIATMRSPEKESELSLIDDITLLRIDVTDLDSINNAVVSTIEKFGMIDVLVNNAGYGAYGPLETIPRDKVIRQFNTNVLGLIDVTQAVLPYFRTQKSGVIINVSSLGGKIAFPLGSLYHGTKFAVEGFSEALNYEMEEFGGKVKIIEPGAIATDFAGRSFDFNNDESIIEYQRLVGLMQNALPGMYDNAASPDEIAKVIYDAATSETNQLRYPAGEDAKNFINMRQQLDDMEFLPAVSKQFGL